METSKIKVCDVDIIVHSFGKFSEGLDKSEFSLGLECFNFMDKHCENNANLDVILKNVGQNPS